MLQIVLFLFSIFLSQISYSKTCLGNEDLCQKKYDEITYLTTHNSFNYSKRGHLKKYGPHLYLFPNQERPIQDQLDHGVRALMLDLHYRKGKVVLCHGGKGCGLLGVDLAGDIFKDLKEFLVQHKNEIITLILESYVSTQDLKNELDKSGLSPYLHCQDPMRPWPTIHEMLDSNVSMNKSQNCSSPGRLVILNDRIETQNPNWNLDLFGKFAFETPYSFKKINDMKCTINRGEIGHPLFIFNHFTTLVSGKKRDAKKINQKAFLLKRASECQTHIGRKINFLTVDFFLSGNPLAVTDILNQELP
jgi:hypothetical protein